MEGYNATILAYGQTSSGKTFTMQGGETNQRELDGIVPRAAAELFQRIHNGDAHVECDVKVSCIEIYMEQVFDLLDSIHPQKSLRLRQDTQRNVFVKGMAKICIRSAQEFMEQVQQAIQNRSVAVTRMNARSSRSHIVVILALEQRHVDSQVCKEGKLSLVDLAGSEIVRRTGAGGQQLEEAKTINKSLSALGMVITNLASPNARHIPYCDSKLTRILEDSLGGNVRTTLILNASSSILDSAETLSTLRFGQPAKKVKYQAVVNEPKHAKDLSNIFQKLPLELQAEKDRVTALEHELVARKMAQEETNSNLAEVKEAFIQVQFECDQQGKKYKP